MASRIAPLADGTALGELKYRGFSVIMDKQRDFALLTATNIDGDSYMRVDRKTGMVADAEGETWYKDRRISDEYGLGQAFYSEWSHKFDRGHLTRRNDPTWGPRRWRPSAPMQTRSISAIAHHSPFALISPQTSGRASNATCLNRCITVWQGETTYSLAAAGVR